jgi:hypothetical protein
MKIIIDYDSSWEGQLLNGSIKDKDQSKRNLHATGGKGLFAEGKVSKSTISGILYRLIGEVRPTRLIDDSDCAYFSDIEDKITFSHINKIENSELVRLVNKDSNRIGQSAYLGLLSGVEGEFFSDEAMKLWSILYLDRKEIIDFILSDDACSLIESKSGHPTKLIPRIELVTNKKIIHGEDFNTFGFYEFQIEKTLAEIEVVKSSIADTSGDVELKKLDKSLLSKVKKLEKQKQELSDLCNDEKSVNENNKLILAIDKITSLFEQDYMKDGKVPAYSFYAASLYLQLIRMQKAGDNIDQFKNKDGLSVKGFSKKGFNGVRDMINPLSENHRYLSTTPCEIMKTSGRIEVNIDLSSDDESVFIDGLTRSKEIKKLIEQAGVATFRVGKKGVAHIVKIK